MKEVTAVSVVSWFQGDGVFFCKLLKDDNKSFFSIHH
jgi:hypothetical protein